MSEIIRNVEASSYYISKPISPSQSLGWVQLSNGQQMRYDEFVRKLFKLMPPDYMKFHRGLGITGEAGELVDVVKTELIYNKATTKEGKTIREGIVEELGDLRFYMQAAQNLYGITEQEVLQHNACKLMQRYEGLEYSDKAAQDRLDKVNTTVTDKVIIDPLVLTDTQLRAVDDTAGLEEINHPAKKPEGEGNVQD